MENEYVNGVLNQEYTWDSYRPSESLIKARELYERRTSHRFKIGDTVRLKTGKSPLKVLSINSDGTIDAVYISCRKEITRDINDFTKDFVETVEKIEERKDEMKDKLFEVLVDGSASRYGVGVAVNSKGQYVLEMKDSNTYEAFDVTSVKKVMPFTYDVMFSGKSQVYSYLGTEGEVAVDDILLAEGESSFNVAKVVAINTASENATKRFKGRKLATVALS
jgi:hypothetical protein